MIPLESFGTVSLATVAVSVAVSTQHTNVTDKRQTPHDRTAAWLACRRPAVKDAPMSAICFREVSTESAPEDLSAGNRCYATAV